MYIDAHCHLERETYGPELEAVMQRARDAGVSHFIAVGATRVAEGAREVMHLVDAHNDVYAAVGLHPHDAAKASAADEALISDLVQKPKVVALGEIGLDYYYEHSPRQVQQALFARMLNVARVRNLPVMLHIRDAHSDAWKILDDVGLPERGGVVHCFTAGPHEAGEYLKRGMYLSIPGVVTYKNAQNLRDAVREIPLDKLLLETDCPYLAPVPYRGKRNEPAYVVTTAAAVGAEKNLSGAELGSLARANTLKLFGIA